jgi:hypothetical protein
MKRIPAASVLIALAIAACSAETAPDPSAEFADEVIEQVAEELGAQTNVGGEDIVVPEGCTLEIQEDEYGFETESVRCPDDTTTTSLPDGAEPEDEITTSVVPSGEGLSLNEWLGSADARNVARRIRSGLLLQTGCDGDLADLEQARVFAAVSPEEIRDPLLEGIAALERSAAACNVDPALWHSELDAALGSFEQAITAIEALYGA